MDDDLKLPSLEEYLKLREEQVTRVLVIEGEGPPTEKVHSLTELERKALTSIWTATYYSYQVNQYKLKKLGGELKYLRYVNRKLKKI